MAVIYEKMKGCTLGQFSTLKFVNGSNFKKFKEFFLAEYVSGFVVPAETFDNVNGKFPIGFTVWNTSLKSKIETISTDIYDKKGNYSGIKNFYGNLPKSINKWIKSFDDDKNNQIGLIVSCAPDFQHNNQLAILSEQQRRYCFKITAQNLIRSSIYFSVRHCLNAIWLNDRDQFLFPNNYWQTDSEFQNDCLTFALFYSANSITSENHINHWIPFTEQEVNAQNRFESSFMTDFISGKQKGLNEHIQTKLAMDDGSTIKNTIEKLVFSAEANEVFNAGRELWKYYHSKPNVNVNASLYDIREYFQGRNEKGRMNSKSDDEKYMKLIGELRNKLDFLADKIKPKIYEYGFLKE